MRSDARKRLRNLAVTSELKTLLKQFRQTLQARQAEQAKPLLHLLTRKLQRAAAKGVIHHNAANRRVSRLARALQGVVAKPA